jgi:hypothetical protein
LWLWVWVWVWVWVGGCALAWPLQMLAFNSSVCLTLPHRPMQRELTLDLEFALVRGASAQPSWAKSADGDDKKPVFIHYEFTAPQGVSRFPPHTLLAFTVACQHA